MNVDNTMRTTNQILLKGEVSKLFHHQRWSCYFQRKNNKYFSKRSFEIRSIGKVEGWGPLKRSKEKVHEGGPRRKPEKRTNDFFYIYENLLFVLFCMPSGTPFLPLIRALSITFVRFLLYYFSIFLAKCAMQADDAFCYFNVVFFVPPFSFCSPFV